MVDDVPLVASGLLEDGMMAGAEYLVGIVALQNNCPLGSSDGFAVANQFGGRVADGVAHTVVLGACVVL